MAGSPPEPPPGSTLPDGSGPTLRLLGRARRRRLRRRHHLLVGAAVFALSLVVVGAAAAVVLVTRGPDPIAGCPLSAQHARGVGGDTLFTAADGSRLGFVPTNQNSEPVPLRRMSRRLPQATVAIEDRRFWQHGALDPLGLVRSAVADITAGHAVQGGSTITQQLVRNRYLQGEQMTLSRKLTEACLSLQLYQRWSRQRILETYLNSVYYGHHSRGVQAASWMYFSRPARRLTLAQAALLAGLPQAPSNYDPLLHPANALARRNAVLAAMRRSRYISIKRYVTATAKPLELHPGNRYGGVRYPPFFDAARSQLAGRLGADRVAQGGLRVQTTLDPHLQGLAQQAVNNWIGSPGDPSAALVAIDPGNGDVRAMAVATPGVSSLRFNLATQSHRQAGSAFKVFTLATALQQGIPLSSVWNGPPSLTIPNRACLNANGPWVVHNFADESSGTMTLDQAIAHSVNTIFAQVAVKVGPPNIVRTAQRMGVTSPLKPVCSITLGPEGVSPLEMTDAFATLADGGIHHAPQMVQQVGTVAGAPVRTPQPRGDRALSPQITDQMTSALTGVIKGGTGTAADPGRPAAGKTGTAESFKDAWFCGYVPQLATCVWIGHPEGEIPMTTVDGFNPVVGGSVPARIWHDFMVPALAGTPVLPLPGGGSPSPTPSPGPSIVPSPTPTPSPSGTATPAPSA